MARLLHWSRFMVIIGIVTSLLLAALLFLLTMLRAGLLIADASTRLTDPKLAKAFGIASIELADLFLIATALYIVGGGLYELFVGGQVLLPSMRITSLDGLKDRLINVVVVVVAVAFAGQVANWDGQTNLLPYGAGIGLVILALAAFGVIQRGKKAGGSPQ